MKEQLSISLHNDYMFPEAGASGANSADSESTAMHTAWKNDKVIFAFSLFANDSPVSGACFDIGDFNCGEAKISAANIEWSFLADTKAFMGNGRRDNGSRQSFPDVLYSNESTDIPMGAYKHALVNITVPKDAEPGVYSGKVIAKANGGTVAEKDVSFEVLPLTAPDAENYEFDMELWQYPFRTAQYYSLEPFGEKHMEVLREHLRLYKRAGGHAITASIVEEPWNGQTYGEFPSMIKWTRKADKSFAFDFTVFDKWVSLCREMGMGDKIVCYSLIPWGNKITYYDEKKGRVKTTAPKTGNHKYNKIWRQFLTALMRHSEEKGYFDSIYIGIDERRNMGKSFDVIESVKNSQGKCFKKSVAMNHFSAKYFSLIDRIDSISVGSETVKKESGDFASLIERRKSNKELKTTLYTCVGHFPNSFTYSMPLESYWTMMFCAKLGTTGYLRWALDAWVEDPLRDTTHTSFEAGDCFLIYPDEKNSVSPKSKSSVRYEMLEKGLLDVNKLYFIAAQGDKWDEKVKNLLSAVKPSYSQLHDGIADAKARLGLPQDMMDLCENMNDLFKEYAGKQ